MTRFHRLHLIFFLAFGFACNTSEQSSSNEESEDFHLEIPQGFPEMPIPEGNELTAKRVALGKKMFFDPILSLDTSISCASCHFQHLAFSDSVPISKGVHGKNGIRNAQPLINLGYNTSFFRDGGVKTLEMQVMAPLETEEEMHLNIVAAAGRLKEHPEYPQLIKEAYNRTPDPFSITRAIAAFERTLLSGNSAYDQYVFQGKEGALSEDQLKGMELFESERLKCNTCHSGFNFTNQEIVSNGLYESYEKDGGRFRITLRAKDEGKFKVPTLRNVALTGPYMHDGSMNTLEEVIDHYASGGSGHVNKSDKITGFEISETEKAQLIAFLNSLTDESFVENLAYKP